jgi:hypothetical protein
VSDDPAQTNDPRPQADALPDPRKVVDDADWARRRRLRPDPDAVIEGVLPPPRREPIRPQRLSEILQSLASDPSRDRISVADMLETMRARAFGALLLIFAFPNILPAPPGLSGILGLPLIFLSFQMMIGREPWLPQFIARRSIARTSFETLVGHATPWLARAERLLRARLRFMAWPVAQRLIGAVCLTLSVALALPIPFANMAPALAICFIGLGVVERDGVWIMLGLLGAAAALVYAGGLSYALVKSALFLLTEAI